MSDLFRVPRRWFAMGAALAVLVAASPAASADDDEDGAALPNGGFETGTLAHWRVSEVGNDGEGWSADRGTRSPVVGFPIPGPPQGMWQAVSDQTGPGSHVLYRDIRVRDDDLALRLTVWYRNLNRRFITPPTLDPSRRANQQFRVDLVRPGAPVRSMAPHNILATIFRTRVGDPPRIGPRVLRWNLSRFEDRTVRLRIAEVDNQFFFEAGVDAVRLVEAGDHEESALPSGGAAALGGGAVARSRQPAPVHGTYVTKDRVSP